MNRIISKNGVEKTDISLEEKPCDCVEKSLLSVQQLEESLNQSLSQTPDEEIVNGD